MDELTRVSFGDIEATMRAGGYKAIAGSTVSSRLKFSFRLLLG